MAFSHILFDLDGTLTDPALGITNSVMYALNKFGIEVDDRASLYKFIGPPLYDSFVRYYGFTPKDANLAITYYREYFAPKGLYENTVYEGIEDALIHLKTQNVKLIVATSKPEKFAREILAHFALDRYFDDIIGATMDEKRNTKDAVIAYAVEKCNIDTENAVMVGDRLHDVLGAKANGIRSIGVLYGFGSYDELTDAGADIIVENVANLINVLTDLISV